MSAVDPCLFRLAATKLASLDAAETEREATGDVQRRRRSSSPLRKALMLGGGLAAGGGALYALHKLLSGAGVPPGVSKPGDTTGQAGSSKPTVSGPAGPPGAAKLGPPDALPPSAAPEQLPMPQVADTTPPAVPPAAPTFQPPRQVRLKRAAAGPVYQTDRQQQVDASHDRGRGIGAGTLGFLAGKYGSAHTKQADWGELGRRTSDVATVLASHFNRKLSGIGGAAIDAYTAASGGGVADPDMVTHTEIGRMPPVRPRPAPPPMETVTGIGRWAPGRLPHVAPPEPATETLTGVGRLSRPSAQRRP